MENTLCCSPNPLDGLQLCPSAPLDLWTMLKSSGAAPGQVWADEGYLHLKASEHLAREGPGSAGLR